jgi:hypothetical protein
MLINHSRGHTRISEHLWNIHNIYNVRELNCIINGPISHVIHVSEITYALWLFIKKLDAYEPAIVGMIMSFVDSIQMPTLTRRMMSPRVLTQTRTMYIPWHTMEPSIFMHAKALQFVRLPDGMTIIPEYAFDSCPNLTEIILPTTLQRIEQFSFNGCSELQIMPAHELPATVVYIGYYAFYKCTNLRIRQLKGHCEVGIRAFYRISTDRIIVGINVQLTNRSFKDGMRLCYSDIPIHECYNNYNNYICGTYVHPYDINNMRNIVNLLYVRKQNVTTAATQTIH